MVTFPFVIVNAFTRSSLGGNPAAIVALPRGALNPAPSDLSTPIINIDTMGAVAKSFAQPVTVFVAPPGETDDNLFDIRYFLPGCQLPTCGHGTLATTMTIHRGLLQELKLRGDGALRFRTASGLIISACAVPAPSVDADSDGTLYQIELPVTPVEPILGADRDRVHQAVARALRKDAADLDVQFVGRGTGRLSFHMMVVLNADEQLDGRNVDPHALVHEGVSDAVTLCHLTPGKVHTFESRVFAPALELPEDHVCGNAHTLMVPYYASLPASGIKQGEQTHVKQVSPRGADLWITLDEKREVVVLRGNAILFAKGEVIL
ncbi:hypothetical protein JVU11DRAFT_12621 [Chiua virens]|nr:hypothetical protein JVU11DRAFT_12621 [Chiua virens]